MRISRACTEQRHAVDAGQPLEDFLGPRRRVPPGAARDDAVVLNLTEVESRQEAREKEK
jgi:hypothetical protein